MAHAAPAAGNPPLAGAALGRPFVVGAATWGCPKVVVVSMPLAEAARWGAFATGGTSPDRAATVVVSMPLAEAALLGASAARESLPPRAPVVPTALGMQPGSPKPVGAFMEAALWRERSIKIVAAIVVAVE